ncbi:hypothetical protein GCK72_021484 [Caenorhabditis remanei]|uniref:Uncharacterized protein n=1 Tax=Caenorhabditis remanei TaxID=31234 RepID=A0A6A5GKQ5_CAERE|nr:hypothetical protein GCK72_021484 [Caenorhabditis remanei]KAF1754919.1 hypothetical protein GCK72_021484 [Caenorhabditis remanei]
MGYAPRERSDLLEEEIIIKPIKKPFPTWQWFILVFTVYFVVFITTGVTGIIADYQKLGGLSASDINNTVFALIYVYINILQWFPLTACIFIFNQQLFCGPKAYQLKRKFIYSFVAQFFTIPLLIINTYISAQVYLIISKLRPEYDGDELYEVIEGSEGSSTKKTDD